MHTMIRRSVIAFTSGVLRATPCPAGEKLAKGEARQIAEEAFIYGFPMVINYGVVYESFIDKSSPQYKCPINQLHNTARVFTPKDTWRPPAVKVAR